MSIDGPLSIRVTRPVVYDAAHNSKSRINDWMQVLMLFNDLEWLCSG
jgi:hypothetical protein